MIGWEKIQGGKANLKRWVLSFERNVETDNELRVSGGREFQSLEAMTEKALFEMYIQVWRHIRGHTVERNPFFCDYRCAHRVAWEVGTNAHRRKVIPMQHVWLSESDRTVTSHMMIHTGEKEFMCDKCNKQFRQGRRLRGWKAVTPRPLKIKRKKGKKKEKRKKKKK